MAARTPRRSFATPFVITLAAVPACYVQSGPAPQQPTTTSTATTPPPTTTPPPATTDQPQTADNTTPPPVVANPPRPTPQTTAVTPNTRWRIYKDGADCKSAFVVSCPPKTMCNPPPPKAYECPTQVDLASTGPLTILSSADGMSCSVEWPATQCKPGTACNPPRPVSVSCPTP